MHTYAVHLLPSLWLLLSLLPSSILSLLQWRSGSPAPINYANVQCGLYFPYTSYNLRQTPMIYQVSFNYTGTIRISWRGFVFFSIQFLTRNSKTTLRFIYKESSRLHSFFQSCLVELPASFNPLLSITASRSSSNDQ